jgi:coenzyme PQQ precursor peptide PqqA
LQKTLQIAGTPVFPAAIEGETNMWHKPTMREICVGAEINSYISAGTKSS